MKSLFKQPIFLILVLILLAAVLGSYFYRSQKAKSEQNNESAEKTHLVKTMIFGQDQAEQELKAVGAIEPATAIEVVALNSGAIIALSADMGQTVKAGQVVARLNNPLALTSLNNAQANLFNMQNNYKAVKILAGQSTAQAELNLQKAQQAVQTAEISLQSAQNAYDNALSLQGHKRQDSKSQAVIAFYNALNTGKTALDQVNYIIGAEGSVQLDGISYTLSALDAQAWLDADRDYWLAKNSYVYLQAQNINAANIELLMPQAVNNLGQAKKAVDDTIRVLDATIPSAYLAEAMLVNQRNGFAGLRAQVVNAQTSAQAVNQNLQNLELVLKTELDQLTAGLDAAKSQLSLAKISYNNVQLGLASSQQTGQQQIIGAQASLDNAQGQYNLVLDQVNNLTVKAPIAGQITKAYFDLGAEVNPGQPIFQVAQTNLLIIKLDLTKEQAAKIKLGQTAVIDHEFIGAVNYISPVQDSITKKISVEIIFDNDGNQLMAGGSIEVSLSLETTIGSINKLVPLAAVLLEQDNNFVFIYDNGRAKKQAVQIGQSQGNGIEIIAGLEPGQEIIWQGQQNLKDQALVKKQSND